MSEETKPEGPGVREGQRIAKVMARAGVCSRRDAEAWIAEGRVSVNGKVLDSPAFNVSDTDDVRVDGKPLGQRERTRLFLFHKPRGLVTTARDPEGRPTVFEALPPGLPRLVAVGRLDINSEGLLLLTNDGGLARVLELPSTGWLRRYRVRAHGTIDQATLDRLIGGIAIDGVDYLGIEARLDREQGDNVWITMGLREGKNREIKKVLEHLGLVVNRLIRVSFGPFELGDLAEGEAAEVRTRVLRDQLGTKLAKEASADFDAPDPERSQGERRTERGRRGNEGVERAAQRLPDRDGNGRRSEHDEAPRRPPPRPSAPERRRKHVSALRAEIAADAAGPRRRVERGATHDRKGRTIAVERISASGEEARLRRAGEKQLPRTARPKAGKRGGRAFEAGARLGRSNSFETRRARDGEGRERPPHSHQNESGLRPDLKSRGPSAERRESGPRERRFDRHEGKRDGQGQDRGPRTRDAAAPARGREFERPHVQMRDRVGKGRPPGAGAKDRGPRSEFKPSGPHADARDGARRARSFDRPADQRSGDQRSGERKFERPHGQRRDTKSEDGPRRVRPGTGSPKGANGPRRPPRKP
jgi:23S rRNA pseudouridine2605 synthase